jgi:quercetin dioxygenase-like cupin family protein
MQRTSTLSLIASVAAGCGLLLGTTILAQGEPEPIVAEPLSQRHAFTDGVTMRITQEPDGLPRQVVEIDDASHLAVMRFTIQPGVVFPWHTHPGTVLISIAEGDFVFMFAEDCVRREYTAGTALVDPGDTVHTAYNPSADGETVVVATFLGVPAEGGLTIPVDDAQGAALDEQCGIDRDDIVATHGAH